MSEWIEIPLGRLAKKITKGTTPPKGKGFVNVGGINYIKSDAISYDGTIDVSKFSQIDTMTHNKFLRSQLHVDDILFSMAGIYLGKNGLVTESMLPANTNQALAIIRLDKEKCFPKFLSYFLRQETIIEYVNNMSGQSAQPNINFSDIASINITLPPLTEQKAIAGVLSSLDDKIDLLHRQNKTLEAMAETLFRQWFIEEAEDDWEEAPLSSIAVFLNGVACQKYPPKNANDKLPVLKIKDLRNGISNDCDYASTDIDYKYIVKKGDIIFSWSASLMVKIWDGVECILNQHLFKVTSNEFPKWFIYQWCKQHMNEFISISSSHATTMGHIKRSDLDNVLVIIPPDNQLELMTKIIEPLMDKQQNNAKQLETLTRQRNILLPKLMSGDIVVKSSERRENE